MLAYRYALNTYSMRFEFFATHTHTCSFPVPAHFEPAIVKHWHNLMKLGVMTQVIVAAPSVDSVEGIILCVFNHKLAFFALFVAIQCDAFILYVLQCYICFIWRSSYFTLQSNQLLMLCIACTLCYILCLFFNLTNQSFKRIEWITSISLSIFSCVVSVVNMRTKTTRLQFVFILKNTVWRFNCVAVRSLSIQLPNFMGAMKIQKNVAASKAAKQQWFGKNTRFFVVNSVNDHPKQSNITLSKQRVESNIHKYTLQIQHTYTIVRERQLDRMLTLKKNRIGVRERARSCVCVRKYVYDDWSQPTKIERKNNANMRPAICYSNHCYEYKLIPKCQYIQAKSVCSENRAMRVNSISSN